MADRALHDEVEKWDELRVDIQAVIPTNPVALEIGFKTLVGILDEILPEFDQEEFLIAWRERTKNDLERIRKEITPQVISQRSNIQVPRMDIPGSRKKLH